METIILKKISRLETLLIGQENVLVLEEVTIYTGLSNSLLSVSVDTEKYNETERFMDLIGREQKHRHKINLMTLESDKKINSNVFIGKVLGQILAIIALVGLIGLCGYAFHLGYAQEAQNIAVGCMIGIVGLFITGKYLPPKK